ncbi:antiviral protein I isoform X2 [Beta vulgaris subsp. vulgaris]|nr:antiviral protein I isoform X2 [Beta vulgaris subsp. vulgaris]
MKEKMTNCFLVVVLAIWIVPAIVPTKAADVSLNLLTADESDFSRFLTEMRVNLTDPNISYGGTHLPVMAASTNFILVDLEFEKGTMTLAFRRSDLYLEGYLDQIGGNYRAHFFLDASPEGKASLFPNARGANNRIIMFYKGSYPDIEKVAKDRSKISLGIYELRKLMIQVYGQSKVDVPTEAKLMLLFIQMISEAARFKYIENKILETFYMSFKPDPKILKLETSWQAITVGIRNSRNGVISPALKLDDVNGRDWIVSRVQDIVDDMALLKYEGPSTTFISLVGNNNGGDHAKI